MANLGTDLGHLVALMLGALCVLLGFLLVARGVGTTDSESSLRIAGLEFKLSRVGPGILFALIGVVLVYLGIQSADGTRAAMPPPGNAVAPATGNDTAPARGNQVVPSDEEVPDETPPAPPPVNVGPALVDDGALARQHEAEAGALRRGLGAMAEGSCPAELFGPAVQSACQQQLWWAPANLQARGPIRSVDLEGPYQPGSSVNIYRVRFDNSEMRWAVSLGGDGRLMVMASPG